ncbi:GerAB/ArcD/ProY family transporter [Bacillus sp. SD075]|uniref:GerAB/ArcD/ProY family transporter n=1 Tax=Bacillus sp. SD075 TaxID=2781732 RepID=UPI001A9735BF|nr:GerAB/ArcD/ProY family transporter [Bacillus sp. SD075]
MGNFIETFWMPDTPLVVLNILIAAVDTFTVRLGIESFTRSFERFFIPVSILLTIFFVSIIPQENIQNFQQVAENGPNPLQVIRWQKNKCRQLKLQLL